MAPLFLGSSFTGYAKIALDLTERKRTAEALQRAHDEMEVRVLERTKELAEANAALISEINERKTAERQRVELLQRLVTTQEDERRRIARGEGHLPRDRRWLHAHDAEVADIGSGHGDIGDGIRGVLFPSAAQDRRRARYPARPADRLDAAVRLV